MPAPRVSIIIPNFDNGRSSSLSGRDLLGELFASLERTLAEDPTTFEIVVADDGSTDDSLDTCRAWASKRWPDARPFLRLIEGTHCGVLSRVLNVLERESHGEFLARLDGDILLLNDRWLETLVALFGRDERIGVVTATQLLPDGSVHAFGDDLWGPRGYRHIARGARLDELPAEREVDHAMGCFYMTRRAVHARVGGYDESVLRGQTEEYGVRVRLDGWKVMATSRVAFEHRHVDRLPRANRADAPASLEIALERFHAKWGFDRLAPDLDEVRQRYAATPLWWRDLTERGVPAASDEWQRLSTEPALAQRLTEELELAARAIRAASGAANATPLVTQIGSGCGCLGVSLARSGISLEGFELPGRALDVAARAATAIASGPPRFVAVDELARLPVADRSRPIVLLFGTLERAWNPVGVLREARRIVTEHGVILLRTELRTTPLDDPDERGHRFTADELLSLVRHIGGLAPFGFDPRVLGSGWLEGCFHPAPITRGRGYFSTTVAPKAAVV